jgi:predicted enzyme related to lactoylglutathione lyase
MAYHHGKFVWFEYFGDDLARAQAFYAKLFGWSIGKFPMGAETYDLIQLGEIGIGGFRRAPPGTPNAWMSYMSVADVDASADAAVKAGAKLLMPPADFHPVGRGATIADPTGAVISIWKSAEADRDDVATIPTGDWIWNELVSTDASIAVGFYQQVFGYTNQSMSMSDGGTYNLMHKDGIPRCGIMQAPAPIPQSFWLPYVCVDDCDASCAKAEALGGKGMLPPMDIPGVGRIAAFTDPMGGAIAVIRDLR